MSRAHTKCSSCGDIMWFADTDQIGQDVVCPCGATELTEGGPIGDHTPLSQEEIDGLPN